MPKPTLKKELQKLSKEQLIEQILDLHKKYKSVKEYYTVYLNPDSEQGLFEKYKAIIIHEFYPETQSWNPKTRFSVAKKAISDFSALNPSPELLADLMMTLAENACQFTYDYGDMWEQYYDATVNNFERALKYLQKEGLLEKFKPRCEQCLEYAKPCGYCFPDEMKEVFHEYYQ